MFFTTCLASFPPKEKKNLSESPPNMTGQIWLSVKFTLCNLCVPWSDLWQAGARGWVIPWAPGGQAAAGQHLLLCSITVSPSQEASLCRYLIFGSWERRLCPKYLFHGLCGGPGIRVCIQGIVRADEIACTFCAAHQHFQSHLAERTSRNLTTRVRAYALGDLATLHKPSH